jgi:NAD(P)-dependent dehydrogenase (short-subunit alcohol dehydrogenase family)
MRSVKVFLVDRNITSAEVYAKELNAKEQGIAAAAEADVADWKQQVQAFEKAIAVFGRIDYVYPIAGIGEKRWIPGDIGESGFQKPDLSVRYQVIESACTIY